MRAAKLSALLLIGFLTVFLAVPQAEYVAMRPAFVPFSPAAAFLRVGEDLVPAAQALGERAVLRAEDDLYLSEHALALLTGAGIAVEAEETGDAIALPVAAQPDANVARRSRLLVQLYGSAAMTPTDLLTVEGVRYFSFADLIRQRPALFARSDDGAWELVPERNLQKLTLSAVGDCILGSDDRFRFHPNFWETAEQQGLPAFFRNVRHLLQQDDVTLANLENPLTENRSNKADKRHQEEAFWFYGPPAYAQMLADGGVDVVSFANNHSHDYGEQGYRSTLQALEKAGVGCASYESAFLTEADGITLAVLSYNALGINERGIDLLEFKLQAKREIEQAARQVRVVVVAVHWGTERQGEQTPLQTDLGRYFVDCGAQLVIGTHPHVLQPIERYKTGLIVYSLGNFCYGGRSDVPEDVGDSVIFRQSFYLMDDALFLPQPELIPCRISSTVPKNDFQPVLLTEETDRQRVLQRMPMLQPQTQRIWPQAASYPALTEQNRHMLVEADRYIEGLYKDIRYCTANNFTGQVIYAEDTLYLRRGTAEKLAAAAAELREAGLHLLVWDGFRAAEDQFRLWEAVPDPRYVADPTKGFSNHTRGCAVDVTLAYADGTPVPMPTDFDQFGKASDRNYGDIADEQAVRNARLLERVMQKHGFEAYSAEWWHFNDSEQALYPPVEDAAELLLEPSS